MRGPTMDSLSMKMKKKKTASGFEFTSIGRKDGALTTELQPQPVAS